MPVHNSSTPSFLAVLAALHKQQCWHYRSAIHARSWLSGHAYKRCLSSNSRGPLPRSQLGFGGLFLPFQGVAKQVDKGSLEGNWSLCPPAFQPLETAKPPQPQLYSCKNKSYRVLFFLPVLILGAFEMPRVISFAKGSSYCPPQFSQARCITRISGSGSTVPPFPLLLPWHISMVCQQWHGSGWVSLPMLAVAVSLLAPAGLSRH